MQVRSIQPQDADAWERMRAQLWPDDHQDEIEAWFASETRPFDVFVLEAGGKVHGFIEVGTRSYAEGCHSSPVAYIEGWWVDADFRGRGGGRLLVEAAESWTRQQGLRELASDCEIENSGSLQAHISLGFQEVERIICMRKQL